MSEAREKMLDKVIRIYGFEHKVTILFAEMLEDESYLDSALETALNFITNKIPTFL